MYCTFRATLVVLLGLVLAWSVTPVAGATAESPAPGEASTSPAAAGSAADFTRDEAEDLLAKAERQFATDTRRVRAGRPVGNGASTEVTMTLRDLHLARPLLRGEEREAAERLLARPSDPGGDWLGGPPAISYPARGRAHWCPPGGVACLHWVTTGTDRVNPADADADGVPNYVETVYATVAQVWKHQVGTLRFRAPRGDNGSASDLDNPDARIDIYLADLGNRGLYGYCAPEGSPGARQTSGYCVLDNDFSRAQYGIAPINALRVTTAHEFFHVIQFGYDVKEDIWMMEGTAAWMEDEVYDSINDNYQFLGQSPIRSPGTPLDYSVGMSRYGSFVFFKYAAERLRDRNVVRQFWEYADAPRNRYSLQAIRAVLSARRVAWPEFFTVFGSWNTLPARSYAERSAYPTPAFTMLKVLSTRKKNTRTTGWRRVSLPHLSSSAVAVLPHGRLKPRKRLLVEVNAPDTARGSTALVQRRFRNGTVSHTMMRLNRSGDGRMLLGFNRRVLSSVVVVVSNTSTQMRDCGSIGDGYGGPVYSCFGRGVHDLGQRYAVRATLR